MPVSTPGIGKTCISPFLNEAISVEDNPPGFEMIISADFIKSFIFLEYPITFKFLLSYLLNYHSLNILY